MARSTRATFLAESPAASPRLPERRRRPRQKIDSLVYLNVERDNGGILLDLSEGGMCISVANPLVKSSTIHFSLRLEENWRMDGTARVSWVSDSGRSGGVNFLDLPDGARQWILRELGERNRPTEAESAEVHLEAPEAAAEPAQTPVAAATRQPALAICEPMKASAGVPERDFPSAITLTAAPPPSPVADAPLGPPETPHELASTADEPSAEVAIVETPLFFLLRSTTETEERPGADFSIGTEPAAPLQESRQPTGIEEKPVYQPPLRPAPARFEREEVNRFLKDVLVTTAIVATVLAIGIATIFLYTGGNAGTSRVAPTGGPLVLAPSAAAGAQAGSPRGEKRFPVEAIDSVGRRWIVMATGRMPVASKSPSVAAGQKFTLLASRASAGPAARTPDSVLAGIPAATTDQSLWGWDFPEKQGDSSMSDARESRSASRQMAIAKPIVVEARVGRDGAVEFVRLLSSPASPLACSIEKAVQHWRYRPLRRHGRTITFTTRIRFDFSAPNGSLH